MYPSNGARTLRAALNHCVGVCLYVCKGKYLQHSTLSGLIKKTCPQTGYCAGRGLFVSQTQVLGAVARFYKHPTWWGCMRESLRWVFVALGVDS